MGAPGDTVSPVLVHPYENMDKRSWTGTAEQLPYIGCAEMQGMPQGQKTAQETGFPSFWINSSRSSACSQTVAVLLQVFGGCKAQGPQAILPTEGFQVHPLLAFDRNHIVIPFLVIPDEQILGQPFGIGQFGRVQFSHTDGKFLCTGLQVPNLFIQIRFRQLLPERYANR